MLAAVLHSPNNLTVEQIPTPVAGPGEIVLKIDTTTLCGTDGRLLTGAKTSGVIPDVVLGHEIAGRIHQLGEGVDESAYPIGAQATVSIVVSCNSCPQCLTGLEHLCNNLDLVGYGINGGFAEYMVMPANAVKSGNVILAPKPLPSRHLALAEPLSCVLNGQEQLGIEPGDTVVVLGAGPIGLLHTQLARYCGASQVIVTNRGAERRKLALEMGATLALNPETEDLKTAVLDATRGLGADAVIVGIGDPGLANVAIDLARPGGRVNYFAGFPKGSTSVMEPNLIHYKELKVTGGSNAPRRCVQRAVDLLAAGAIDADKIVTAAFGLKDIATGFEYVMGKKAMKVAIEPALDN